MESVNEEGYGFGLVIHMGGTYMNMLEEWCLFIGSISKRECFQAWPVEGERAGESCKSKERLCFVDEDRFTEGVNEYPVNVKFKAVNGYDKVDNLFMFKNCRCAFQIAKVGNEVEFDPNDQSSHLVDVGNIFIEVSILGVFGWYG